MFAQTTLTKAATGSATVLKWEAAHHLSGVNNSIYGHNLLCITKQSCLEGKATNKTETLQRPRNSNSGARWMGAAATLVALFLLWVISVSFVSWWRGRMRGWHRGRRKGGMQQMHLSCSPRPLPSTQSRLHSAARCYDTTWGDDTWSERVQGRTHTLHTRTRATHTMAVTFLHILGNLFFYVCNRPKRLAH